MRRIKDGQSILDDVRDQARTPTTLSDADRQRLDLFLTSIREAEQRLQQDEAWANPPKPQVNVAPSDRRLRHRPRDCSTAQRQWYDLVHLALQTDSTRVISLWLGSQDGPRSTGVTLGHHDASHHGQDPAKLEQLALIEEAELQLLRRLPRAS